MAREKEFGPGNHGKLDHSVITWRTPTPPSMLTAQRDVTALRAIPVSPTEASGHPSADDVDRHSWRASGVQYRRDDDQVAHGASKALCAFLGPSQATAMVN